MFVQLHRALATASPETATALRIDTPNMPPRLGASCLEPNTNTSTGLDPAQGSSSRPHVSPQYAHRTAYAPSTTASEQPRVRPASAPMHRSYDSLYQVEPYASRNKRGLTINSPHKGSPAVRRASTESNLHLAGNGGAHFASGSSNIIWNDRLQNADAAQVTLGQRILKVG
jgi:hypothetical protein